MAVRADASVLLAGESASALRAWVALEREWSVGVKEASLSRS